MCAIKAAAAIDPRFQGLFLETNFPWGAAPGLDEQAPLALNTYGVVDPPFALATHRVAVSDRGYSLCPGTICLQLGQVLFRPATKRV
jgi:hypothetical protein